MNNLPFLTTTIFNKALTLTCITASLAACGGGGGGSSSGGATEVSDLEVTSVQPEALAEGVERNPLIRAQFSDAVFSPSVDSNSFYLSYNGEALAGSTAFFDATTMDLSTDETLRLLSPYTASITTDVTDLSGLPLANSFEWSFVTRDGIWRTQESIAQGVVDDPLMVAGAGNTLWAFYRRDNLFSMQNDIFARPLQEDYTFSIGQLISNGDGDGNVDGPVQTTLLNNGDMLAVWQEQAADMTTELWYNRFDSLAGEWGDSQRVVLNNVNKSRPLLVGNHAGDVSVLFEREDILSMESDLVVVDYDIDSDEWLSETLVVNDLDTAAGEGNPSMAIDSEGNTLLIFERNNHVWSRYYNAGTETWQSIALVSDNSALDTHGATQLVVDSQNTFTAIWVQEDDIVSFPFIWSNRYTHNEGWSEAESLIASERAFNPQLAIDQNDNLTLIWQQNNLSGANNLLSSYFDALGSNWLTPELLEQSDQPVSQARLTVDPSGNVMAMWQQNRSGTFFDSNANILFNPPSVWVSRFDNSGEGVWHAPQAISSLGGTVDKPVLSSNSSGEIVALWIRSLDGTTTIQSRQFD